MEDLTGRKFGFLTVLGSSPKRGKHRERYWNCECQCGGHAVTTTNKLKSGHTKSCGCYQKKRAAEGQLKHGMCDSPTYHTWRGMKERCLNPKNKAFKWYGGFGVKICNRWMSFEKFLSDMGERPKGKTLERINHNGDYEPDNCKWLSSKRQQCNTRANRLLSLDGKTMCLSDWARHTNINYETIRDRLKRGWSTREALSV